MGWFDNEQDAEKQKVSPAPSAPRSVPASASPASPSPPPPSKAPETGSTLGREIKVKGTIVCGEDLTILGTVAGTIRAKGTLVIAKEADVRAKIDGHRVRVDGAVEGDVHGAERVVLGQTGRLTGNIEAPTIEIIEGAYFKGNVEMFTAEPAARKSEPVKKPRDKAPQPEKAAAAATADKQGPTAKPNGKDGDEKAAGGAAPAKTDGPTPGEATRATTSQGEAASKQAAQ